MRGKDGALGCAGHKTVTSNFCLVIPSKQLKNDKIGQNRLILGDLGFQDSQIGQIS